MKLVAALVLSASLTNALDWGDHSRPNLNIKLFRYTNRPFPDLPHIPQVPKESELCGVMISIESIDPETIAFRTTIKVRTEDGKELTQTRLMERYPAEWKFTTDLFLFGPYAIEVLSLTIEELRVSARTEL